MFFPFLFRGAMESNVNRNDFTELSTRWSISVEVGCVKEFIGYIDGYYGVECNWNYFLKLSYSTIR